MKKQLFTILLLSISFLVFAENDNKIIVKTTTGLSSHLLSNIKSMRFNNGFMSLSMNDGSATKWNTDNVQNITFGLTNIGIETSISQTPTMVSYDITNHKLTVKSISYIPTLLFDIEGKCIYSSPCIGEDQVDLSSFPNGIYILNINGNTYKIINK